MNVLRDAWSMFSANLFSVLSLIKVADIIDILVVAFLFYQIMRLVRETRAMQLVKGIAAVLVLFFVAQILEMITLRFFIQNILTWGVMVVVVVFQPELRRALDQIGRTQLTGLGRGEQSGEYLAMMQELIGAVCTSAAYLSSTKTGALMVIERQTKLGEIVGTGTEIDAKPSMEMISNIFFHNAPLHDGAVVIRNGRLLAAGCYLPLSQNMEIGRELGTRHRAALGMSEQSDAVVVVVSEETGAITVAVDSKLQRGLSEKNLEKILTAKLLGAKPEELPSKKAPFWRRKKS